MILNYKKYGERGEHLIILHGLFGMLDNWHTLATRLGEKFQVWAIDQRNHGKSPHTDDISYPLLAQDLAEFYTQHNIKEANVIGHSMGGKTAMEFALRHPDNVSKLIIVDIAPKTYTGEGHYLLIQALKGLDLENIKRRNDADEALIQSIPVESTRQFLLKNLTREGDKYVLKMNLDSLANHYDKLIGNIEAQGVFNKDTLFIKGGNSEYILDKDKPVILKIFTKAEFITIPNSGHWVHAEAPVEFYNIVMEFLNND